MKKQIRTKGKRHPLKKAKRAKRKLIGRINMKFTPAKPKQEKTTVGVRYATGPSLNRVFTYQVRCPHPFTLGAPVVVDAAGGMALAFVVRIDDKPNTEYPGPLKWLRHKVVELHRDPGPSLASEDLHQYHEWPGDEETPSGGPP